MRRSAANLSSTGRIAELWAGIEQASFMRRLATKLTDPKTSQATFEDLIGKMKTISAHALKTNRIR